VISVEVSHDQGSENRLAIAGDACLASDERLVTESIFSLEEKSAA